MKLLQLIFLLYNATLVWWPCSDVHTDHGSMHPSHQALVDIQHAHTGDLCSPFCTCGCCGVVLGLNHTPGPICKVVDFPVNADKKGVARTPFIPDSFLGKIWQPPQYIV